MTADEAWAPVAVACREALALLGFGIAPRCMPGEPEECGGSSAQHAMAYLGTLKAVADHQLAHMGPLGAQHAEIYWRVRKELEDSHEAPRPGSPT